jgi:hypothetical protein
LCLEKQIQLILENINDKLSTKDIYSILPYISNEIIDKCSKKTFEIEGMESLTSIAPFISSEVIDDNVINELVLDTISEKDEVI